ncbi:MAG: hypothetical protein IIT46_03965 [Lachnospiraceae bacterium]|nr:hypothetical protein [Lachnospiraceae bacterium]
MLLSKTSEAKSEIRDAAVPASAERESGTSYDMLERIQKAKDYVEIGVDVAELEGTSAEIKATYEKIKKYVAVHNDGMMLDSRSVRKKRKRLL